MTDAPERIWASPKHMDRWDRSIDCSTQKAFGHDIEYLRADAALALVAEAYEVAAQKVSDMEGILGGILSRLDGALSLNDGPSMHANGQTPAWFVEAAHAVVYSAEYISDLTPSDALAAREARDKRVRDEALREAADVIAERGMSSSDDWDRYRAIFALIEGDQTDE